MASLWLLVSISMVVLATAMTLQEKKEVPDKEMEEILEDEHKHKLSDEVLMFGNQQNKPAGMVDDELAEALMQQGALENKDTEANENAGASIFAEGEVSEATTEASEASEAHDSFSEHPRRITDDIPMDYPDFTGMEEDEWRRRMMEESGYGSYIPNQDYHGMESHGAWDRMPTEAMTERERLRRWADGPNYQHRDVRSSLEDLLNERHKRELGADDGDELMKLLADYDNSDYREEMMRNYEHGYGQYGHEGAEYMPDVDYMYPPDMERDVYGSRMGRDPMEYLKEEGQLEEFPDELAYIRDQMKRNYEPMHDTPPEYYGMLDEGDGLERGSLVDDPEYFSNRRLHESSEEKNENDGLDDIRDSRDGYTDYEEALREKIGNGFGPDDMFGNMVP